jgi:dienelactone hydrolase
VAVQTGEGTIEIIYGSTSIPAGPQTLSGYLARPDAEGEWPTVLLFGPEPVPTSSVKNICRVFARHGIVAIASDMTESHDFNARIATRVAAFVSDPAGEWANAQF